MIARAVLAVTALVAAVFVAGSAASTAATQRLTLYTLPSQEQFLNHADDRQRGYGKNPFGNFQAPTATTRESNNGPFPGDQAFFAFKVYSGPDLKKLAGSAVFTCNYNFKHHGFCDATYDLGADTFLAAGPVDFDAKTFTLVVTGGTGKYEGLTGAVTATPGPKLSQRLTVAVG
jgi:hypothetical protein